MESNQESATVHWRRRSNDDCEWAHYGNELVVYHKPSGKTHLLNDVTSQLLSEVLLRPVSLDDIVALFAPPDEEHREAYREEFRSILSRLDYFGFVECVETSADD